MPTPNILIYLLRKDLRLEDNPIFHAVATDAAKTYTHLLPVYAFPAQQIEVSGFIPKDSREKSPYPEARSNIGKFWRCGPHRAKFIAESVWELKETLGNVGSGLEVRVGMLSDVLKDLIVGLKGNGKEVNIGAVWMTAEEGVEEKLDEKDCKTICDAAGVNFKLWKDEKYFVDEYVRPSYHMICQTASEYVMPIGSILTQTAMISLSRISASFQMFSQPIGSLLSHSAKRLGLSFPRLPKGHCHCCLPCQ